jgi:diaminopimelate epimerase
MTIKFSKYHGNGNDFIIIDNRNNLFPKTEYSFIRRLCDRNFGIGADGLMLLEKQAGYDFRMIYYNSDGHEGSMCGNGGRCLVKFAKTIGVIADSAIFAGIDGIYKASIDNSGVIRLKMQDVNKPGRDGEAWIIDTGSPHYIIFTDDIEAVNVIENGRKIRYGEQYKQKGINVNFVERAGESIRIRTYERGVENETLSCGTGSVAAALAFAIGNGSREGSVTVETRGGPLKVSYKRRNKLSFSDIWLTGPATHVFDGTITVETPE